MKIEKLFRRMDVVSISDNYNADGSSLIGTIYNQVSIPHANDRFNVFNFNELKYNKLRMYFNVAGNYWF